MRISAAMARTAFLADTSEEEARERRELARQSGNPAWLWPEVAVAQWLETMRYVSEALSSVLSGRPGTIPPSDPRTFSLACYTSGTGPLLGYWVERRKLVVPDDLEELLALHLENARARASKTESHSREIVSELVGDGVPVVILKGAHTGHAYFPDPATRPASDLDLLVPSDFAAQAEVSLAKRGLQCAARNRRESSWKRAESPLEPRSLWLAHADDPWCVDLQSSLDFSASPGARPVRFDSADPIGTSDPWPLNPEAGALSQPLLLLHLAAHASGGLHSLTLLRMVEIILVIRKDIPDGRLSWDDFLHLGAVTNALGAAYPALRMSEKLAPGTVPAKVLSISAEIAPPRARAIVDRLEPATVHRVDRASVGEHFMWVSGFSGWCRQLASDIVPGSESRAIYEKRAYRLLRGRISR